MSEELKAAQARIACLEGEIAKRDEELAACRVAVENCELFRARIAELEARIVWLECEAQVNAAPVSEAKAQGVVMPERMNENEGNSYSVMQAMAFNQALDEVARLNAAPVQQVSVPDGWKLVPVEPTLDMGWAYVDAANDASPGKRNSFNHFGYRAMLAAAPAAPAADAHSWRRKVGVNGIKQFMTQKCYDAQTDAIKRHYEPFKCANCKAADAGLVEALEHARLFIVNGIDLGFIQMPEADTPDPAHETLPMIDAALAAHRAQGVE